MNIELSARRLTTALFATLLVVGLGGRASAQTAVSACQTLSVAGNYFLTKNLKASGDCLVIAAANVAIDLKGKTIKGNGSGSGITDDGSARDFAIIANGTVTGFNNGVNLPNSGSEIISNLNSSNNSGDGILIGDCCNTLNSVTANKNGATGILITSDDSSLNKIEANGNGSGGISMTECCNTVVASTASKNTGVGVLLGNDDTFVVNSKMQHNSGAGLEMQEDNGVIKTTTSKNGGDGMLFTSSVNQIIASKSTGNGGVGIDLVDRFGVLSGVSVTKNKSDGVDMLCRGSTASLTAQKNQGTNLVQTIDDGPCANADLNTP